MACIYDTQVGRTAAIDYALNESYEYYQSFTMMAKVVFGSPISQVATAATEAFCSMTKSVVRGVI